MTTKPNITTFYKLSTFLTDYYDSYIPNAFDESLTILQKLNKVIEYLNQTGKITNDLVQQWNDVVKWMLDDGIDESVVAHITKLVQDGTLDKILNDVLMNQKADKVVVDQLLSEITGFTTFEDVRELIKGMNSGVKAIYNDFTELMQQHPKGDTFNYVLKSDGHVYYWTGTEWRDTGINYINTYLTDKSVTEDKTTFVKRVPTSVNLFDKSRIRSNTGISAIDGTYYSSTGSYVSNKIILKASTRYSFLYIGSEVRSFRWVERDKAGNIVQFKEGVSSMTSLSTSEGNTLEVMANSGTEGYFMIVEGSVEPIYYVPYTEKNVYINQQYQTLVKETDTSFMTRTSPNLFNKNDVVNDAYLNVVTKKIVNRTDNVISKFINVKPNTEYTVTEGNSMFHFNKEKVMIGDHGTGITTFRTLPDQYYLIASCRKVHLDKMMLVEGTQLPSEYHPYDEYTLNTNIKSLGAAGTDFSHVRYLALGDSITEGIEEYPHRANKELKFTLTNLGVGGTTAALREGTNATFNPDSLVSKAKNTDFSNYDVVTISFGTNDWSNAIALGDINSVDEYSYTGALNTAIQKMLIDNPTIQIVLITPTYRKNADTQVNGKNLKLIDYVNAVKQIASKYKIDVLDFYNRAGWNQYNIDAYTDDGLHPNSKGQINLGGLAYQTLLRFKGGY